MKQTSIQTPQFDDCFHAPAASLWRPGFICLYEHMPSLAILSHACYAHPRNRPTPRNQPRPTIIQLHLFPSAAWHPATTSELRPLIANHYSRRHPPRRGTRLGGCGAPIYLANDYGSALIATYNTDDPRAIPWRQFPSWWLGLHHRHPTDPARASAQITAAIAIMSARHVAPIYTTVDPAKIRPTRQPGRCFLLAGFRYLACTTKTRLHILAYTPPPPP